MVKDMTYELKHSKYKVMASECDFAWAGNGRMFKYNNKRIGLGKNTKGDKSVYFIYGRMMGDHATAQNVNLGRNVWENSLLLSEESMELIALAWAEMNGLSIVEKK